MSNQKVVDPMLLPHLSTIAVAINTLTTLVRQLPQGVIPAGPKEKENILLAVRDVETRTESLLGSLQATASALK